MDSLLQVAPFADRNLKRHSRRSGRGRRFRGNALFCKSHTAAGAQAYLDDNHSISVPSGEGVFKFENRPGKTVINQS
jgi:hypothetical protein